MKGEKTFSEMPSKNRKRGRPHVYPSSDYEKLGLVNAKKSTRQQQNYLCAIRALTVIREVNALPGGVSSPIPIHDFIRLILEHLERSTATLAALGRIKNDADLVHAAFYIAHHDLRGARALAAIKMVTNGDDIPDWQDLFRKMRRAVRAFSRLYPTLDAEQLARRVRINADEISKEILRAG